MKLCYVLSSRQKKELLIRGTPLRIALPAAPIEVVIDDLLDWARSMLPTDLRPLAKSAEEQEVRLMPHSGSGAELIPGRIHTDRDRPGWTIPIAAVVVLLEPANARHPAMPIQWPADVLIDGQSLLESRQRREP